ncbi:MAG TPA: hypothetical protein ENI31_06600 [Candidatus Omnitrophica bacterium]|nr:hypothetical protein [Candidatus Omnitrophota bacterium]
MKKLDRYDLLSLGIILFVIIFQVSRFRFLPQFIDDYYHLLVARSFLKAGGWVGVSFWDYAPVGRPHLYPPFYHFLIAGLLKLGISGIISLRILGVVIPIVFFLSLWLILRKIFSTLLSFLVVLITFSSFSFYISLDANLPATLGIIFSFLSFYFLKKNKLVSSLISLTFSIYTHTGVFLAFVISLIVFSLISQDKKAFKVIFSGFILGLPLFIHQLRYIEFLKLEILREMYFTHYNLLVIILGIAGIFFCLKKRGVYSWFPGLILGFEIIFLKYPYRFFSAQGLFCLSLLSAVFLESIFLKIRKAKFKRVLFFIVIIYFLFINSSIILEEARAKFRLLNSTFSELSTGRFYDFLEFREFTYPEFFFPLKRIVLENTDSQDIIASNNKIVAVLLGSITNRAISTSIFREVRPFLNFVPYSVSKIIIWVKSLFPEKKDLLLERYVQRFKWEKIFENDIAYVYKNPYYKKITPFRAAFPFFYILLIIGGSLVAIFLELKFSSFL